jgi:hypothetical protein
MDAGAGQEVKRKGVWIVEVKFRGQYRWKPTVGVTLTQKDGLLLRREWQGQNPDDRFRLTQYLAVRQ